MSTTNSIEKHWKFVAGRIGPKITLVMGILFLIEGIIRISLQFFFTKILHYS